MILLGGILIILITTVQGLYPSSSDVVSLTASNFDRLVEQSDAVWVIEFFAPWCGHCKALVPEYSKAATALKGVIKVGAVNCDDEKSLAGRFGIRGFPTVKIFGADKKKPTDYNGPRTAQGIIEGAMDAAKKKINANLSGKKSGSSSGSRSGDPKDVVQLTDDNFASTIYNSKDYWLVEFYSPGCGYCQQLAPEWAEAATKLKGKAKLAAIDATSQSQISSEYEIHGFPTMFWFEPGAKGKKDAKPYDGGRKASEIVDWVMDMIAENAPPPEVVQLVNEDVIKNECTHPLCVIAVLPHILDCQSSCRNNYIKMLTTVAEKYKKKLWGWMWVEGGAQLELEQTLDIGGFGYPAMAVLNSKKQKFSLLKGSFSEEGISEFLRDLSFGRGQTYALRGGKLPNIVKTEAWNGEDQALPEEEDIDLSDVVLDDIKEEL